MSDFEATRTSMKNNLVKGDYLKALDKISDNLSAIKSNNKELRTLLSHIGSKRDSKPMNEKVTYILQLNGDLFLETNELITEFKDFSFPNNKDRIGNIRQLKMMESTQNQLKQEFDTINYKISRQNKSIIDSISNNVRPSLLPNKENHIPLQVFQGEALLEEDKRREKENQVNIIQK